MLLILRFSTTHQKADSERGGRKPFRTCYLFNIITKSKAKNIYNLHELKNNEFHT